MIQNDCIGGWDVEELLFAEGTGLSVSLLLTVADDHAGIVNHGLRFYTIDVGQDPVEVARGDHAVAVGALSSTGDVGRPPAVRTVRRTHVAGDRVGDNAITAHEGVEILHMAIPIGGSLEHTP